MRLKCGLALFQRTSDERTWNVASFHSWHSLTWSWILSFSFFKSDEGRWWPLFWLHRTNQGLAWGLRFPPIGLLRWQRQRPMWYRDMYLRNRNKLDEVTHERNVLARKVPTRPTERSISLVPTPGDGPTP